MPNVQLVHPPGPVPSDEEIKEAALQNRKHATELLIRRYREPLFHHAAYILKDWHEAIDVTQEVFIRALRQEDFFSDGFKMKAWLYRVASNLCFNMRRDRNRRRELLAQQKPPTEQAPHQNDRVFEQERQERILEAIDTLSEDHRKVIMLRYYSDLSYAEIAEVLDLQLGTVMSRLSRARARLLDALDLSTVLGPEWEI